MPILGVIASQISGHLVGPLSYDSIATYTPSSGTSFTFSSIPSTYKHLQLRINWNAGTSSQDLTIKLNGNAPTQAHYISAQGQGTPSVGANNYTATGAYLAPGNFNATYNNYPTGIIIDILDYTNTNKYKTIKLISGAEYNSNNTASRIMFDSAFWSDLTAISNITITQTGGSFGSNGNSFALYGIKG